MDERYGVWAARWRVPLGFALGVAYLIFSQPSFSLLTVGGALALPGLLLRAWSAGCLAKNQTLATSGPYAFTRNPLYLGSALMGLGFALAGGSWGLGAAFLAYFLAVYWPVIRREAQFLSGQFGDAYDRYAQTVPLFFPKARWVRAGSEGFQWERYRQNREYEAAFGWLGGMVFLTLKIWLR